MLNKQKRIDQLRNIIEAGADTYPYMKRMEVYEDIADTMLAWHGISWSAESVRKFIRKNCRNIMPKKIRYTEHDDTDDYEGTDEQKTQFEEKGNDAVVTCYVPEIPKSLRDVLRMFGVDTDIWEVDKYTVNSWTTTTKDKTKPNYQIKVYLIRKVPIIQELPPIKPIEVTIEYAEPEETAYSGSDLRQALVIGDAQIGFERRGKKLFPFHDRSALSAVLEVANYSCPDTIIILGDMLDLPQWSDRFLRHPDTYFTTQPALVELANFLGKLRLASPYAKIVYLEGNHEQRLRKFIYKYMMEAYDIKPVNQPDDAPAMSVEYLLGLKDLNIEYMENYPNDAYWLTPDVEVYHGNVARASGKTAGAMLNNAVTSRVAGHCHRIETASKTITTKYGIQTIQAHTLGCLCKIDGSVPGTPRNAQWQQGFGMILYSDNEMDLHRIENVPIVNGATHFDSMRFVGRESNYLEALRDSTKISFG